MIGGALLLPLSQLLLLLYYYYSSSHENVASRSSSLLALESLGILVGRVLLLVVAHLLVGAYFLVDAVPVFEVVQAIARRQ